MLICVIIHVFVYVFSLFLGTLVYLPKHIYFCISFYIYISVRISTLLHKWVGLSNVSCGCQLFAHWLIDVKVHRSILCLASAPEDRRLGGKKTFNIAFENDWAQESHGGLQQMLGVWTLARDSINEVMITCVAFWAALKLHAVFTVSSRVTQIISTEKKLSYFWCISFVCFF